jgi:hypothetical protein
MAAAFQGEIINIANGVFYMTNETTDPKDTNKKEAEVVHPGMMGDGSEEQTLDELGNPSARIKKTDVDAAFGKQPSAK